MFKTYETELAGRKLTLETGNLAGKGSKTWYTGSASWYYMAGIEYILGFKIKNNTIKIDPCIPKDWKEYEIKYRYENAIYNIKIKNPDGKNKGVTKIFVNGKEIEKENGIKLEKNANVYNIEVIM